MDTIQHANKQPVDKRGNQRKKINIILECMEMKKKATFKTYGVVQKSSKKEVHSYTVLLQGTR